MYEIADRSFGTAAKRIAIERSLPRMLLASSFLSGRGGNPSVTEDLAESFRTHAKGLICVSPYRSGWLRGAHMLCAAVLRRLEYDVAVVDVFSGRAFLWAEALSRVLAFLRCPMVLVLHGGGLPDFARRHAKRVGACLKKANLVVAPSNYLVQNMKAYREDLQVLRNPLLLSNYPFKMRERPRPHLVWLRAFHRLYNPSLVAKVTQLLVPEFPELRVTMAGPDKEDGSRRELERLMSDTGLTGRISLCGAISRREVPGWMNQGDIFLNTTNLDNTPVSVLEAMALGMCVVSTNVGGIPYLLEHEHDALLVPPDDPAAMADAVRRLLTEPGLAEKLSRNARHQADQYDWRRILPRWEGILNSLSDTGT